MTQSSDAEGRVAVGGNATFTNFGIGDRLIPDSGDTRLVVGGDLTYNGGQIFGGGAVVGAQVHTDVYFNCAPDCGVTQASPIDFDAARTHLTGYSQHLNSLGSTGTTDYRWGGIWLQAGNADLHIFDIDGSQFSGRSYLNLQGVNPEETVVFNILGDRVEIANFGMNLGGVAPSQVLFNFTEASQIQTSGFSFNGSVLATEADVNFSNGNVQGHFIANSVAGSGEFHNVSFAGDLPTFAPPEVPGGSPPEAIPETSPWLGVAVLGMGFGLRRWQQSQRRSQQRS